MKRRTLILACLMICFGLGLTAAVGAQPKGTDPLSGSWSGDWGPSASDRNTVVVDLKWDGKALTGTVNPGPNAIPVKNATFDAKTGAVHMEADTKNRRDVEVHFVIEGKLDGNTMSGSWNHDTRKGDFKITKK
jgi:hypothetical protein